MSSTVGTAANNNWVLSGAYTGTLDGLGGVDSLSMGTSLRSSYTIVKAANGGVQVDSLSGASTAFHCTMYNMEILYFNNKTDTLDLTTYFGATNNLPTGSVTIAGTPTQGRTLTAANTLADTDGLGTIAYQWSAGTTAISGATSATFTLTEAQVGKTITVTASYTDGHGTAESVKSSATTAVLNLNDAPTGAVTISGTLTQGQTLTAANTLADPDGLGTIAYQWSAGTTAISSATSATFTLTEAQVGKTITVAASYTDAHGTAESVSSSASVAVANVNDPGHVTVSGVLAVGQTLTGSVSDADGVGSTQFQWLAGGLPIEGATSQTFVVTQAQIGQDMALVANYIDGHGQSESVTGGLGFSADVLAYSWKAHTLLEGVALGLGTANHSSDAAGSAIFAGLTDPAIALSASRSVPSSEASATSSAVNLQDAIAILKMIVGLDVNGTGKALSPYQALAADYDGNGLVQLSDAIGVLKHVVGLTAPDPAWHFVNETDTTVPAKASLTPGEPPTSIAATQSGSNPLHMGLVGYLTGDVDGSFAGATGAANLDQTHSTYLTDLLALNPWLHASQFGVYP